MKRSIRDFGKAAAIRYRALIRQALNDVKADPERPGSKERPEIMIQGARTYHLQFSRSRVIGQAVKERRHFLLYRRKPDGVIQVARLLDDVHDLARHLPDDYQRSE